ncbi:MAG: hypothetical protein AAFQ98_15395 [Bacteroidota bacterium]
MMPETPAVVKEIEAVKRVLISEPFFHCGIGLMVLPKPMESQKGFGPVSHFTVE